MIDFFKKELPKLSGHIAKTIAKTADNGCCEGVF